jgi:hypothetical protein
MRTRVEVLGLTPRRVAGLRANARVTAALAELRPEVMDRQKHRRPKKYYGAARLR